MNLPEPRLNILAITLAIVVSTTWAEILEPFFAEKYLRSSGLLDSRNNYLTLLVPIIAALPIALPIIVFSIASAILREKSSIYWVSIAGIIAAPIGYLFIDRYSRVTATPGRLDYFYLSFLAPLLLPLAASIPVYYLALAIRTSFTNRNRQF